MTKNNHIKDFTLIGAGIMSATLGVLIKKLIPDATISIYERLDKVGAESSAAWNNAGTGHSSFCELNYTAEKEDGSIDLEKALHIASSFEESKQFWAYLKENNYIDSESCYNFFSENSQKQLYHENFETSRIGSNDFSVFYHFVKKFNEIKQSTSRVVFANRYHKPLPASATPQIYKSRRRCSWIDMRIMTDKHNKCNSGPQVTHRLRV